jgi:hypothetical protein
VYLFVIIVVAPADQVFGPASRLHGWIPTRDPAESPLVAIIGFVQPPAKRIAPKKGSSTEKSEGVPVVIGRKVLNCLRVCIAFLAQPWMHYLRMDGCAWVSKAVTCDRPAIHVQEANVHVSTVVDNPKQDVRTAKIADDKPFAVEIFKRLVQFLKHNDGPADGDLVLDAVAQIGEPVDTGVTRELLHHVSLY